MKSDSMTYNATIIACEKGKRWITAMPSLQGMQQWHMHSNAIAYNAAIGTCEKASNRSQR